MPIKRRPAPSDRPDSESDLLDLPLSGSERADLEPPTRTAGEVDAIGSLDTRPREGRRIGGWWLILFLAFPIGALVGFFSSSDPPVAVLSTDLLDFGEIVLGDRGESQAVRISNQGEQALWITGTALQGEAAEEFRIVADECAGLEVAAQADCAVRLAFEPTFRGARQAQVRFDGNAVGGPHTVPLIGVGVAPELAVEPAGLDFGQQIVGSAGAPFELRVANPGTAALELGRIELTGAATDFRRVADGCSARQLAPGERCSVRYSFTPTAAGERRASVRIESNARDEPVVSLVGRGVARLPILRLDVEALDFGRVLIGEASEVRTIEISNDGNGRLLISGLRLEDPQDVAAGGAFELATESCTEGEVPAGGGCEIGVRFRPAAESVARSELLVDSRDSVEPHRVALAGAGTAPHVSVDRERLSFGEVGVRAAGRSLAVQLTNSGTGELAIGSVAVTGADAGSFSAAGCSGATVAPGGSCAVEVRFRPRRAGPHRADLVVQHNADRRRHRLPLNGLGAAARLSLSSSRIDFGEIETGAAARRRLVLTNSGRSALEVRRVRLTGGRDAGFELDEDRCSAAALRPAEACAVAVLFQPTSAGARSVQLAIDHSAADRAVEVPITATATAPPVPEIQLDPTAIDFLDRRIGERSTIETLTIHNPGTGRLILEEIRLGGEHAGDFQLVAGSCDGAAYVAPGARCTVGVRFTPTVQGARRARLLIAHSASQRSAQLALEGRGTLPPPLP